MWLSKLLGYDLEIVYENSSTNKAAHALSKREEEGEINGLTKPYWLDAEKFDEEVQKDFYLSKVIKNPEKNLSSHRHYTLEHGRLFIKGGWFWHPIQRGYTDYFRSFI